MALLDDRPGELASSTSVRQGHLTGQKSGGGIERLIRGAPVPLPQCGETWTVTSGLRTTAEQQALWDDRASNPYPVARPGTSRHEHGNAADVTIGGRAIQDVVPRADLVRAGISPLAGDAVHVELLD